MYICGSLCVNVVCIIIPIREYILLGVTTCMHDGNEKNIYHTVMSIYV